MSFFNSIGRSMTRASQRNGSSNTNANKRSPTPSSGTGDASPGPGLGQQQHGPSAPPSPRMPSSPRISPSQSQAQLQQLQGQSQGHGQGHGQGQSGSSGSSPPKPLYLCSPFVDAALVKGNFKTIVMLPKYVDIMEWVAVNVFDFYNNLNEFYGVITECCTPQTCPTMSAGQTLSYTWINQERKSVHLPAPTYIDYVMTWIQNLLDDENTFPTKSGQDFPPNFPSTVKHVYRQLLRVFAHLYHAHFAHLLHLRAEPHFNSLFAHFLAFGREYDLLEVRDVRGTGQAAVGVGALWERWREMGILEG